MANIFKEVSMTRPKHNTFDLTHHRRYSMKMGELTPIMVMDCIPGDVFRFATSQLIRFAPMVAPIMESVGVFTHYFFVPNRLLWNSWNDFITGGESGTLEPSPPTVTLDDEDTVPHSLADFLGLPSLSDETNNTITVSALPFAAYQLIYNEFYRDQNLIQPVVAQVADGDNTGLVPNLNVLRKRAWQHDYFTSALPWTQKGVEAMIPLGTTAPLVYDNQGPGANTKIKSAVDGSEQPATDFFSASDGSFLGLVAGDPNALDIDVTQHTFVDLSEATAASINDLRRAIKLQEWLEKNARGGSRYTESILVHFGVKTQDSRLQRPEFIGGGSSKVTISEVLQQSAVDGQPTPQGNMAGHGINVKGNPWQRYYCQEHGYIIGLMSIQPKPSYFQGVPKHFLRRDRFDYFWPSFANLGEQAIENQELYADQNSNGQLGTFGYTPRYAEYKYIPNTVHGTFRTTLDFWHMARKFIAPPNLNQAFIEADPTKRIFAVEDPTEEDIYCHIVNEVKAKRPMPVFGTPKF